jgi:RNA polymerase sigma factor (sigma-70 family)
MKKIEIKIADYYEKPIGVTEVTEVNSELARFLVKSRHETEYIEGGRNKKRWNAETKGHDLPPLEVSYEMCVEICDRSLETSSEWCLSRKSVESIVENRIIAKQAITALGDDEVGRVIVWLIYYNGYTEAEIGKVLKISQQRVSAKLRHCLKKMKKAII